VKQAVVGTGGADKAQVQHTVQAFLTLSRKPQPDAAAALAMPLCHAHMNQSVLRLASTGGKVRSGRVRRQ